MAGGERIYAFNQGHGLNHGAEEQVAAERRLRKPRFDLAGSQQGPDFGGEKQVPINQSIVERLDAQPIAGQQHPRIASPGGLRRLRQGKGKHPLQVLHAILSPFLISVDNHFGVAGRPEGVAAALERMPKLLKVVDLSVEHNGDGPILIEQRLVSAAEVDDAESAHTQGDRVIGK